MDSAEIFTKTEKGIEEIEKRTYHLDFRHRTALIQVDGRNTVEVMLTRITGDGKACLLDLWRDGFIESVSGHVHTQAEDASARNVADAGIDLQQAKVRVARAIESLLGPDGDSLAMQVERAKTVSELIAQAQRSRAIIEQMRGMARGKEFWAATGL